MATAFTPSNPALVLTNGKVFRSLTPGPQERDTQPSFHSCMLIHDGLIRHVGEATDPEIVAAINTNNNKVPDAVVTHNLNGKTVLPGCIDGHLHLLLMGQSLQKVALDSCKDLSDIRAAIKAHAAAHPTAPRIMGKGWMHSMTPSGVHHSQLDDIDPRSIYVDTKDLHSAWLNSAAIVDLGCEAMSDPEGGVIFRDADGKCTGELNEAAVFTIVWPHLASVASLEERVAAMKGAVAAYHAAGYTGMVDMAMDKHAWEALLELRRRHELATGSPFPMRVAAYWLIKPSKSEAEALAQVARAVELHSISATETPDCRIVGIKVVCDGIIDACTAALTEPYTSNASSPDPIWSHDQLLPVVRAANAARLQVALHAIGDRTIRTAIDVIAAECDPTLRPRIEHLELASERDAARLGEIGITASIQPVHSDPAILRAWPRLLGEHRCERAFAYREFAEGGAPLALGSDAPTAPNCPLQNVYVATTRKSAREPACEERCNPHQALGLCQAVAAATRGAAYSCFLDGDGGGVGTLEKGKKADFVVVDMEWDPETLLRAKVVETWFEGRRVFEAPGSS